MSVPKMRNLFNNNMPKVYIIWVDSKRERYIALFYFQQTAVSSANTPVQAGGTTTVTSTPQPVQQVAQVQVQVKLNI